MADSYFVKCFKGIASVLEKETKAWNNVYENKNYTRPHRTIEKNYKRPF